MFQIEINPEKNRLTLTLSGAIDMVQAKRLFFDLVRQIPLLRPQFDVISDMSGYESADMNGAAILRQVIDTLKQKSVRRIIRVVGSSKAALVDFGSNTEPQADYPVQYVPTLEEAERLLDHP